MVELLDLIEEDVLIRLQERFSNLLGFNVAFAGLDFVTVGYSKDAVGKNRAYIEDTTCAMMMSTGEGKERCYKSDEEAGKIAIEKKKPILYRCQSFCSNFVIPIKVSNEIVGFLYSGQFFACAPGVKTEREWRSLQIKMGVSNTDWAKKQKEIKEREEKDWETLVLEGSFFVPTQDGRYIRASFFHEPNGRPTDDDLEEIAENGNLVTDRWKKRFVATFREKSNTDRDDNRVKDAREIIRAIKILSEIANALSEECNIKYALKTYFETCQEIRQASLSFYDKLTRRAINSHLEKLSREIIPFIQESKEAPEKRAKLINTIDSIALAIYEKLLRLEAKRTLREVWKNGWLYLTISLFKKQESTMLKNISEKAYEVLQAKETNGSKESLRERKERFRENLYKVRQYREELLKARTFAGPLSWVGIIVTIVSLLIALKQLGWI